MLICFVSRTNEQVSACVASLSLWCTVTGRADCPTHSVSSGRAALSTIMVSATPLIGLAGRAMRNVCRLSLADCGADTLKRAPAVAWHSA